MTPGRSTIPRLWVVSPIYFDCEPYAILRGRIRDLARAGTLSAGEVRFWAVDDTGGADPDVAGLADESTTAVSTPFNLGHQRALVFGLRRLLPELGDEDVVVTLDADGEDQPDDIPRLLERVGESPLSDKLVIARRTERTEPVPFKVLYLLFTLLFRTLTGTTMRSGNFAAYGARTARRVLPHPYFDLCYSSTLVGLDLPAVYVPCARGRRYAGRSKMGFSKLVIHGFRMLMPFTDQIAIRALIAFTAVVTVGTAIGIALLIAAAAGVHVATWVVVALLGSIGIALLSAANAVVLFAVFSQSRGITLSELDRELDGPA